MSKRIRANCMMVAAAMIWGAAFVAQTVGMEYVEPFTFLACRSLLGGAVLLPVIYLLSRGKPASTAPHGSKKDLAIGGFLCGTILFVASSLQQVGLLYTSAGKSGFITALYVVLVPILGLFTGKKARLPVWIGVGLAAVALYLLCINESFTLGQGELLTLLCALCFAFHILTIDRFSSRTDGTKLSCIQFFVSGIWSLIAALIFETPQWSAIVACALPIGYAGIMSCAVAYTFQILGQKDTEPTVASLILSLESVFAVLFGALLLHEKLRAQEYFGCVLMFVAILLAQLPERAKKLR